MKHGTKPKFKYKRVKIIWQDLMVLERPYSVEDVEKLRGSFPIEYTLATRGSNKLWDFTSFSSDCRVLIVGTSNCRLLEQLLKRLKSAYKPE